MKKHATYINSLKCNNPKKFNTSTAKKEVSVYGRVLDKFFGPDGGVPSSLHIMKDVNIILTKC